LKQYIDIIRELLIMSIRLSTWRFAGLWLIGIVLAVGKVLHWLRWW